VVVTCALANTHDHAEAAFTRSDTPDTYHKIREPGLGRVKRQAKSLFGNFRVGPRMLRAARM